MTRVKKKVGKEKVVKIMSKSVSGYSGEASVEQRMSTKAEEHLAAHSIEAPRKTPG